MKFTTGDTVFYHYHYDFNYGQPKNHKTFFAIATPKEQQTLDSFLTEIKFSKFDTMYLQHNVHDGSGCKFNLTTDSSKHWIYVYEEQGPAQLNTFATWLMNLEETKKQTEIDRLIDFGNLDYIIPPAVPPPPKPK